MAGDTNTSGEAYCLRALPAFALRKVSTGGQSLHSDGRHRYAGRSLSPAGAARPKKSLGQHFLIDPNIARKIVDLADISPGDLVVEIGPGRGILTDILLNKGARVTAIEIDSRLHDALHERFAGVPNIQGVRADACSYPYHAIEGPFKVVSNLPYNISTPILFRLLEESSHLTGMVLMVQAEVADRLTAPVGSKSYGALTILLRAFADIQACFTVPPHCFRPSPKVVSTVIQVTPRAAPILIKDRPFFKKVVKMAFSHRRKFLANALTRADFSRDLLVPVLQEIGIAPDCRAATVSVEAFALLANALYDARQTMDAAR